MKTLTVTYHHGTNYGAVLQTYALQRTLQKLGHENVVLDYSSPKIREKQKFSIVQRLKKYYLRYLLFIRKKSLTKLINHFDEFHKKHLMLTKPYCSVDEMRKDNDLNQYDCLITGSDQVWNLKGYRNLVDARLLLFGSDGARRISYAASLEELDYTDTQKQRVSNALHKFNGISLREENAREYIESFSGLDCERVIDPVALLQKEEWIQIAKKPRLKGPYILCYQVLRNHRMQEVTNYLKRKTGYPVVSICNSQIRWIKSDYSFHDVSIEEFLGFYQDAAYIVTTSFHGTAMGLVFNKPVYALVKTQGANRIGNLMEITGMTDYMVRQGEKTPIKDYSELSMIKLQSIIDCERDKGIQFLKKMLS